MKKKNTIKIVCVILGLLLVGGAFALSIETGLIAKDVRAFLGVFAVDKIEYKHLLLGEPIMIMTKGSSINQRAVEISRPVLSLIGQIMMLVFGCFGIVTLLFPKNKKYNWTKIVAVFCFIAVIGGAVMCFFLKDSFCDSYAKTNEMNIEDVKSIFKEFKLNAAAIISPIMGILGSLGLTTAKLMK